MRRSAWLVALAVLAVSRGAFAQSAQMVESARAQIEALNPDSAYALLQRALAQSDPSAPRARAFTLLGIAELLRNNRTAAVFAFRQALRIDPSLRIDSLADLHSDVLTVFMEQRAAVSPEPLSGSALEPETLRLKHAAPSRLAVTGAIGFAVLALPALLGSGEVNGTSGRSVVVAGAVSVAGLAAFLSGHHPLPIPDAIA